MRAFILATSLLCAALAPTQSVFAVDNQKMLDAYFSVVLVRGYNTNGGLAYGSGVVVGDKKVITNCHVLRSTKQPWISRGEDTYSINSVKVDAWHDLCLVTTDALPFKPAPIGKSTELKRGQEIVAFGHSNGVPSPLTSSGAIKALYDADQGKVIRSTARFAMGASGSGLFDMEGRLVGINTFKTGGHRSSIYFALPIEWLEQLEKQPEITTFPISGKALWEEEEDKKPYYMQVAVPETRGDWPKLAMVAEKWTQAEPKSTEAWYALGLGHENNAKLGDAEKAYKQALALDSGNFDALIHLGSIAKTRGDTAEMHRIQLALNDMNKDAAAEYSEMLGCGAGC
jgi:serine protease Do